MVAERGGNQLTAGCAVGQRSRLWPGPGQAALPGRLPRSSAKALCRCVLGFGTVGCLTTIAKRPDSTAAGHMPYVVLLVVVFVWGAGPVVAKLVTAPPLVAAFLRFAISLPAILALTALRGRPLGWSMLRRTAPPGLAFGVNLIFVFMTLQEATVAVLAVGVTLQPALLLLVVGPMFDERPTRAHVLWTVAGVVGAAAVILGAGSELRSSVLGVLLAFSAMLAFSVYFVLTRLARSTTDVDPIEWMSGITVWASLVTLGPAVLLASRADWAEFGGMDWVWLAAMSYGTGLLGHVLMSWVHGYVEAARSSLIILSMNLVAVGLAWPVHDEPITVVQALGGMVVLLAVAAVIRLPARLG